jgi:hypothetical protein
MNNEHLYASDYCYTDTPWRDDQSPAIWFVGYGDRDDDGICWPSMSTKLIFAPGYGFPNG